MSQHSGGKLWQGCYFIASAAAAKCSAAQSCTCLYSFCISVDIRSSIKIRFLVGSDSVFMCFGFRDAGFTLHPLQSACWLVTRGVELEREHCLIRNKANAWTLNCQLMTSLPFPPLPSPFTISHVIVPLAPPLPLFLFLHPPCCLSLSHPVPFGKRWCDKLQMLLIKISLTIPLCKFKKSLEMSH